MWGNIPTQTIKYAKTVFLKEHFPKNAVLFRTLKRKNNAANQASRCRIILILFVVGIIEHAPSRCMRSKKMKLAWEDMNLIYFRFFIENLRWFKTIQFITLIFVIPKQLSI